MTASYMYTHMGAVSDKRAEAWNKIPASVRESISLGAFKSGYLKWYSSQ